MPALAISLPALAIALIYYSYRDLYLQRLEQDRVLRHRVAYMLWMTASQG